MVRSKSSAAWIASLALVAACRLGYDPLTSAGDGDASPAAPDGAVPPDASGVLPDASSEGPLDATVDAAAAPDASTCAPLADDFSSSAASPRWNTFASPGFSARNTGGRLRVTLPAFGLATGYAGYVSAQAYDLRGRRLAVAVPSMVATIGHAQALLQLIDAVDGRRRAGFEQQHGGLHLYVRDTAAAADLFLPYDATLQRYWQLREAAGWLRFETSPDGLAWATAAVLPALFAPTQVFVELSAGTYQPELAPGVVEFDDLGGTLGLGASCLGP